VLRIKIYDFRYVEDINPTADFQGETDEIDFEVALRDDVIMHCFFYIRNGYILLPEHKHVPEEDRYNHARLREASNLYNICEDFFEEMDSYYIEEPESNAG
jgi:hypothetical protein